MEAKINTYKETEAIFQIKRPVFLLTDKSNYHDWILNEEEFNIFLQCFLLLKDNQLLKAVQILKRSKRNLLNKYLLQYLEKNEQTLMPSIKECINIWPKTNLAQMEYDFICQTIFGAIFNSDIVPNTLIDIGTGDGFLLDKLITVFIKLNQKINIVLIEQDNVLLEETYKMIHCKYPTLNSISLIKSKIEDVDFHSFNLDKATTIVHAASVLHELPHFQKLKVLDKFKSISSNVFISELEANHDISSKDFVSLANSVYYFYSGLVQDTIISDNLTDNEKTEYINNYLIYEAFNILINDYKNRINYHTTQQKWEELFSNCNWNYSSNLVKFANTLPNFLTFHLKS
jgi:hypothetical protein